MSLPGRGIDLRTREGPAPKRCRAFPELCGVGRVRPRCVPGYGRCGA
ncbi:hypothetical protein RAJCM14343_3679 [Rhodococcus aetherivorans]|uniref:Uncharacterized protein n=1 Tax=Rhodococcus aetherivorans TaxID=191292 RepID=A0ABQ0YPL6_9NOCA|nr:hypothetical protein RAJCM14343_3679 [Rhodococcus aetherivorans]CCW13776.1 hypothetical protein EBESD8_43390 [Rhodococcus aetherivorans]